MAAAIADPLPPPPNRVPLDESRIAEVTTLAGGAEGFADGVGAAAQFDTPQEIAVAPSGIIYVVDTWNNRIRQLDPATGAVTTLAGSVRGFAEGVGAAARFDNPSGIAVAPSGIVYVSDSVNNRIRKIDPTTGAVTTLAGSGVQGFADGVGTAAQFLRPQGLAMAPSGVVYVADTCNNRIRQLDPATGAVTTLAGSAEGFAEGRGAAARFRLPMGVAVAPSGIVYVADMRNHRIRQIDPRTGEVTTLAGSISGFAEGVGAAARFYFPYGIAVAPSGIVYVADMDNNRIRQIDPATGAVTTLAGFVQGIADGRGAAAQFHEPRGLAVAPSGIVYVTDIGIRKITIRANPGLAHMGRKAVLNGKSKLGALPEHLVGEIFSYVGNTRGPGGGIHRRVADPDAAAQAEAFRARLLAERGAAAEEGAAEAGGAAAEEGAAEAGGAAANKRSRRHTRYRKANRKSRQKSSRRSRK